MKIAVVGCTHGELDRMYSDLAKMEQQQNTKVDLLLCCGDFQSVRNPSDLTSMAVPPKYRQMNTFYRYYNGQCKAPVMTIFIGGNHEASNYLAELPYGGWVAPNIFYMGLANVIQIGSLRIGAVSGIFKQHDYLKGHFERAPYSNDTVRSVYHVRNLEIFRLKHLNGIDIILSHDWPRGIHSFGNENALFRVKPYFRNEAQQGILGSPPLRELLEKLVPRYWFSAHMHVKFEAEYTKKDAQNEVNKTTHFLALDKCINNRPYMKILDIETKEGQDEQKTEKSISEYRFPILNYDKNWLAILKLTDHLLSVQPRPNYLPGPGHSNERFDFTPNESELEKIEQLFAGEFEIPQNFTITAEPYFDQDKKTTGGSYRQKASLPAVSVLNPQTSVFCEKLGIRNLNSLLSGSATSVGLTHNIGNYVKVNEPMLTPENNRSPFVLPPPAKKPTPPEGGGSEELFFLDTTPMAAPEGKIDSVDSNNSSMKTDLPDSLIMDTTADIVKKCSNLEEGEKVDFEENITTIKSDTKVHKTLKRRNAAIYQAEEDSTDQ